MFYQHLRGDSTNQFVATLAKSDGGKARLLPSINFMVAVMCPKKWGAWNKWQTIVGQNPELSSLCHQPPEPSEPGGFALNQQEVPRGFGRSLGDSQHLPPALHPLLGTKNTAPQHRHKLTWLGIHGCSYVIICIILDCVFWPFDKSLGCLQKIDLASLFETIMLAGVASYRFGLRPIFWGVVFPSVFLHFSCSIHCPCLWRCVDK